MSNLNGLPEFKIRASSASKILSGKLGLTDVQEKKYCELKTRSEDSTAKTLTENMKEELRHLKYKKSNPELPEGAKSYCKDWVKEQLYDRRKNFTNKYVEKGLKVEEDSIYYSSGVLGWTDAVKNDEWFEDDFMCGTPDILLLGIDTVVDIKNAYDCFTMPLFDEVIPTDGYIDQLQVYMSLTGLNKALLCYCLMDAPLDIMQVEMRKLSWKEGFRGEISDEISARVKEQMTYSNLPDNLRLKLFEVQKDESFGEEIKTRVKMCREYIKTLTIK